MAASLADSPGKSPNASAIATAEHPLQAVGDLLLRALAALLQLAATLAIVHALDTVSAGVYFRGFVIACGFGALLRNKYELYLAHYILDERERQGGAPVGALLLRLGQRVLLRGALVCGLLLVVTADLDIYAPRLQPFLETYLPFVLAIPFASLSMLIGETLRAANRTLLGTVIAAYALNLTIIVAALCVPAGADAASLLHWFAWAFLVGSVAAAALAVLLAWRAFPVARDAAVPPLSNACYAAIDERGLIGFAKGMVLWGPLCLLAVWAPAVQMAEYAVAARTAQIVDFFLPALSLAVGPEAPCGKTVLRRRLLVRTAAAAAASTAIIMALLLAAPTMLSIYGLPYAAQGTIYALLLGVHWANGVGRPAIREVAQRWDAVAIRQTLVWSAALAVLLCLALLPRYGALAAAASALAAALLLNGRAVVQAARQP